MLALIMLCDTGQYTMTSAITAPLRLLPSAAAAQKKSPESLSLSLTLSADQNNRGYTYILWRRAEMTEDRGIILERPVFKCNYNSCSKLALLTNIFTHILLTSTLLCRRSALILSSTPCPWTRSGRRSLPEEKVWQLLSLTATFVLHLTCTVNNMSFRL